MAYKMMMFFIALAFCVAGSFSSVNHSTSNESLLHMENSVPVSYTTPNAFTNEIYDFGPNTVEYTNFTKNGMSTVGWNATITSGSRSTAFTFVLPPNMSSSANYSVSSPFNASMPSAVALDLSTAAQAMFFRSPSDNEAWVYSKGLLSKRKLACQCFDPGFKCCMSTPDGVNAFCVSAEAACCGNTFCLPGEKCCGNGCCAAGTTCNPDLGGCCKDGSVCTAPPTCLGHTESPCSNGVPENAVEAMHCCPSSLPLCITLPIYGSVGCYAATPTKVISPSEASSSLLPGTTTITITNSIPTGIYVATATPTYRYVHTVYTTVPSTEPASASKSLTTGSTFSLPTASSTLSNFCFDTNLLSAVPCTTSSGTSTSTASIPADFSAPGITTIRSSDGSHFGPDCFVAILILLGLVAYIIREWVQTPVVVLPVIDIEEAGDSMMSESEANSVADTVTVFAEDEEVKGVV